MLSLRGNIGPARHTEPGCPRAGVHSHGHARRASRGWLRVRCGERADALAWLWHVLIGVVGGAHERPGGDVVEAELVGSRLERGELVGMPVAHDRQVALGGAQVLTDGEHADALLAQRGERLDELVVCLAETDHQTGLGHDLALTHLAGHPQDATRALELRAAARDRVQPRDDLDVVVEHVWALGDDLRERHLLALEVGREHLDLALGRLAPYLTDHADERGGALVGEIVAVDGGDHGVAQSHSRDRARDARGLERIVPRRLAGLDVAEAAAARARVAEDHERRGAALPALADVRARGLLADGVQVLRADQLGQLAVALPAGRGHLEPRRLALAQRAHVGAEHGQHVHAAGIRTRSSGAHAGTAWSSRAAPLRGAEGAGRTGAAGGGASGASMPSARGVTSRARRSWASLKR